MHRLVHPSTNRLSDSLKVTELVSAETQFGPHQVVPSPHPFNDLPIVHHTLSDFLTLSTPVLLGDDLTFYFTGKRKIKAIR